MRIDCPFSRLTWSQAAPRTGVTPSPLVPPCPPCHASDPARSRSLLPQLGLATGEFSFGSRKRPSGRASGSTGRAEKVTGRPRKCSCVGWKRQSHVFKVRPEPHPAVMRCDPPLPGPHLSQLTVKKPRLPKPYVSFPWFSLQSRLASTAPHPGSIRPGAQGTVSRAVPLSPYLCHWKTAGSSTYTRRRRKKAGA